MATLVLSAAGAAVGAASGGILFGISGAVLGRAVGAGIGRAIDQRIMGRGADAVAAPRAERFRITGAGEGAPVPLIFGRTRVAGQVIWASPFREEVIAGSSGSGKGTRRGASGEERRYFVSLAIALGEGVISHVGRIWADGREVAPAVLPMRVYSGDAAQLPDPVIEAVEGAGLVPAFCGTAYVVLEDLDLAPFGDRVPQFSFEVIRRAEDAGDPAQVIKGVALIPGAGEYALATEPVFLKDGAGVTRAANVNSPLGVTDFVASVQGLEGEMPGCERASLVVSWFAGDLRCGQAEIRPKVEQGAVDSDQMPWAVSGVARSGAVEVPKLAGRPVYGGTPADRSVIQAIGHLKAAGKGVMLTPFLLMDQLGGNGLTDPWSGAADQPALPWRGRITLSVAPGQAGSPDGTLVAEGEVAAFFGTAVAGDFAVADGVVSYSGPAEWSYRRFILHNAALAAAAGGVEAFVIGSEMRGLTQIRGAANSFPVVAQLQALAAEVRALLGPDVKIGYAADWSEYFGYQPGGGDVFFHLDPLWADANINFIGIDNYMPLSDWRDGEDHADAGWGSIYDAGYLQANVAGGEGYDWYYPTAEAARLQLRAQISDGAHGEDWIWRFKDIQSWWQNAHHERIGGVRQAEPTAWVPGGKPIWFCEFGCAATDKGTNQPNRFWDEKSAESGLPAWSDGRRDDLIQAQYYRAVCGYWSDAENNPVSEVYGGSMVDMDHAFAWAWDTRPFPFFPLQTEVWSDGANYSRGHWLNGRMSAVALAAVAREVCARSGLGAVDTDGLHGRLRGYAVTGAGEARGALQPLALAYGFDSAEADGALRFRNRVTNASTEVLRERLAVTAALPSGFEVVRDAAAEAPDRVAVEYVEAERDFELASEDSAWAAGPGIATARMDLPLVLTRTEARALTERWLAEAQAGREGLELALPLSAVGLRPGDVFGWRNGDDVNRFRVDRVTQAEALTIEAVRVEERVGVPSRSIEFPAAVKPYAVPVPVDTQFLDLPLLSGQAVAHAPHVAVSARPWPGPVAVLRGVEDADYALDTIVPAAAVMGLTLGALPAADAGVMERGAPLRVAIGAGQLEAVSVERMLSGANLAAVGDGSADGWEVIRFSHAALVGPGEWEISTRLRGVGGSPVPEAGWPAGSRFVLLDSRVVPMALPLEARGLARQYRVGPAARAPDDPTFRHFVQAFDGIGLRPLSPVHLKAVRDGGDLSLAWVRRTRVGGDSWGAGDVPLGEESERYLLRVVAGGTVMREETVSLPAWTYTAAMQAADGMSGSFELHVAQISAYFGPGLFGRIEIND